MTRLFRYSGLGGVPDRLRTTVPWALLLLAGTGLLMGGLRWVPALVSPARTGEITLAIGFLLLAGWCAGLVAEAVRLPRLTGYIVAGIVAGPSALGLLDADLVSRLGPLDDLALTFIALVAGGELHGELIRKRWRSLATWVAAQVFLVPLLVGAGLLALHRLVPILPTGSGAALGAALVLGALSLARSPAVTIALIDESRARGPFAETTLGVTIALDTLVILAFAAAVSVAQVLVTPGAELDVAFLGILAAELAASAVLGAGVGLVVMGIIRAFRVDLPVLLAALAFLITRLSRELSHLVAHGAGVHVQLEPLLMGLVAGILVQNLSREREAFTHALEKIAPPIYVAFFALAGARLDISVLARTWPLALTLVLLRGGALFGSGWLGSVLARDPAPWPRLAGLTALSQAGVSLGLAAEIGRRFPGWGEVLVPAVLAAITLNQVIGPPVLAWTLRVGDRPGENATREPGPPEGPSLAD